MKIIYHPNGQTYAVREELPENTIIVDPALYEAAYIAFRDGWSTKIPLIKIIRHASAYHSEGACLKDVKDAVDAAYEACRQDNEGREIPY